MAMLHRGSHHCSTQPGARRGCLILQGSNRRRMVALERPPHRRDKGEQYG